MVFFYSEGVDFEQYNSDDINRVICKMSENEGVVFGDLSCIFCSDQYLLNINQKYLNHNYYTDIITFEYSDADKLNISGDLFISIDRVKDNAKSISVEFETELKRVVIHGILHLIGYTDKTDVEKAIMRNKENFYLNK